MLQSLAQIHLIVRAFIDRSSVLHVATTETVLPDAGPNGDFIALPRYSESIELCLDRRSLFLGKRFRQLVQDHREFTAAETRHIVDLTGDLREDIRDRR